MVATPDGFVAIESVRVGQRVQTTDEKASEDAQEQDADLHLVRLSMWNPDGSDDVIDIELLRPTSWLAATGAQPDAQIYLVFAEMGLQGYAWVTDVDDCPTIAPGPGRLVMATITHLNCEVMSLKLAGLAEAGGTTFTLKTRHDLAVPPQGRVFGHPCQLSVQPMPTHRRASRHL